MSTAQAAQAFQTLLQAVPRARALGVVVAARDRGDDRTYTLQRLQLHEDVASEFRRIVLAYSNGLGDATLRPYDPSYKPDPQEIVYISLTDRPDVQQIIDSVTDLDGAELFTQDDDVIDRLKFYTVVLGPRDRRTVFFRTYSPQKELSRKGLFALVWQRGAFNKVSNKVFLFDDKIDCFAGNGYLYIAAIDRFHSMFRYFEELRAHARATLDVVLARVPVTNADEFRAACEGQIQMLAKIASISRKDYLARVTMDDIDRTIQDFRLPIRVEGRGGARRLVFEPQPARRWLILKLLDDDYLGSTMTHERYEVNSKMPLR